MLLSWDDAAPAVEEYLALRLAAGLSPFPPEAAARGLAGTWSAACARDGVKLVGMGRVVGDDGCFFQIVDIAVHPSMQRRGLGRAIMQKLVESLRERAPAGAFVSLLADPPGVNLYRQFGFQASAPTSIGMFRRLSNATGERS